MTCACILLAAGGSTRLGKPKQLLKMGGESLLHRSARIALEAGAVPTIVVLGACADKLSRELDGLEVELLINTNWREGMGSSLSMAVRSLIVGTNQPDATLVMVCDQPCVTAELLRALIAQQSGREDTIVASAYSGIIGVPAIFGSAYFADLAELSGERGAGRIMVQHGSHTSFVDFPGGGFDVDTQLDEFALERESLDGEKGNL